MIHTVAVATLIREEYEIRRGDSSVYITVSVDKRGHLTIHNQKDEAEFKFIESRPEMVDAIADLLKEAAKVVDRSALRGGQNE